MGLQDTKGEASSILMKSSLRLKGQSIPKQRYTSVLFCVYAHNKLEEVGELVEAKKTPLYNCHLAAGAKMVEFGGWLMPVQYEGIIKEHLAVREAAGLFDVSHMGEIEVQGPGSRELVQRIITNDIDRLIPGKVLYSPMCYPDGGTVDDLLVYHLAEEHYLLVVNAANIEKDFNWIIGESRGNVSVTDISDKTCQLALQGPLAKTILQKLTNVELSDLKYYSFISGTVQGCQCLISRTGYTGEDGFELYFDQELATLLWDSILEGGKAEGVKPVGLGARDTLRFEAGLALYGNELTETISPVMAGLGWTVKFNKEDFIGKESLLKEKEQGSNYKLVGLEMLDKGIPRNGYQISQDGRQVGWITSGTFAPSVGKNLGLGYVEVSLSAPGTELDILIRGKPLKAQVVTKPFYKREG